MENQKVTKEEKLTKEQKLTTKVKHPGRVKGGYRLYEWNQANKGKLKDKPIQVLSQET